MQPASLSRWTQSQVAQKLVRALPSLAKVAAASATAESTIASLSNSIRSGTPRMTRHNAHGYDTTTITSLCRAADPASKTRLPTSKHPIALLRSPAQVRSLPIRTLLLHLPRLPARSPSPTATRIRSSSSTMARTIRPANYIYVYLDPAFNPGTHTPVAGSTPLFSGPFDITKYMNLNNGTAYVGFTAATGGCFEQHELMGFAFTPHNYASANVCPPEQPHRRHAATRFR